jgi:hypothetical protein
MLHQDVETLDHVLVPPTTQPLHDAIVEAAGAAPVDPFDSRRMLQCVKCRRQIDHDARIDQRGDAPGELATQQLDPEVAQVLRIGLLDRTRREREARRVQGGVERREIIVGLCVEP